MMGRFEGNESGVSRRGFLRRSGIAAVGTSTISDVMTARSYARKVNIAEEGADKTGREPIDKTLEKYLKDDTLIKFPEGKYLIDQISLYGLSNFGMVGIDENVTLLPASQKDYWISGADMQDFQFEGFTIDNREQGIHPTLAFGIADGLVIRNITKRGIHDGYNEAFGISIQDESGNGLIENLQMGDGSIHNGYENGYVKAATGVYVHSVGTTIFKDCHIEGFGDNGLYASPSEGPVRVIGGAFKDNDVSQVRLGSGGSFIRDATILITDDLSKNALNARGIRICDGPQGSGRVIIENCDVRLTGGVGGGGIVSAFNGGAFTVRDTSIQANKEYTIARDGWASHAILADRPSGRETVGSIRIEGTSITGSAKRRDAVLLRERDESTIHKVCIYQPGTYRDGITFDGGIENAVHESTVNVGGTAIQGADSTSNISYDGKCSGGSSTRPKQGGAYETNSITIQQSDAESWTPLSPQHSYSNPVLIAGPPSSNGPHPAFVRTLTTDDLKLQLTEWEYIDQSPEGWHQTETITYIISESGQHSIGNELRFEVGRDSARSDGSQTITFSQPFDAQPIVLTQPQTYNGNDPVLARTWDVSSSGFQVILQEEEAKGWHIPEQVGYIAVESGVGEFSGRSFEVGAVPITSDWTQLSFQNEYNEPALLADIQTINSTDTASLRYQNLGSQGVELRIEDERSRDSETHHQSEIVGYFVVDV